MARNGKQHRTVIEKVEALKEYDLEEAGKLLGETSYTKFDPTVDVAVRLGVNPNKSDQAVRGACALPNGTGKKVRILVFAKGEKAEAATEAGADIVGAEDIVEKIKGGWLEFDKVIATPDMMRVISKVAKTLGTKGLMPNPKVGTVTQDVAKAVKEQKAGKISFRAEKAGIVHAGIGKLSFGPEKIIANLLELIGELIKLKPNTSKGIYLKRVSLSTSMGPGIRINLADIQAKMR